MLALQILAAIVALPVGLFLFGTAVYWFTGAGFDETVRDGHPEYRGDQR